MRQPATVFQMEGEISMSITIGKKPESGFGDPLGMLSDCHRRIERFLRVLAILASQAQGSKLSEEQCHALEAALHYFRVAAPLHTLDEENSLFPRMRTHQNPQVHEPIRQLEALEADHQSTETAHREVEAIGRRWLAEGSLPDEAVRRLSLILDNLQAIYEAHIHQEDNEVFPLAAKSLEPSELEALGREMAIRRGLDPDHLLRQWPFDPNRQSM
jgi:hemerythrin-like domain-containing protein